MSIDNRSRQIEELVAGRVTSDGAGVKLTRLFDRQLQQRLDPFLMLDAFGSDSPDDYIAGFPDHPHRGFETITYMLAGRMQHRDSAGNEGLLESGGVQWMNAGKGVIHSEIPQQQEGRMAGFQLWLNLPAADKLSTPWYRDFQASDLPRGSDAQGVRWTVIAGHSHGIEGAVQRPRTQPLIVDLELPAGTRFWQDLPMEQHAFLVPYEGEVQVAGHSIPAQHLAILNQLGEGVAIDATIASRVLLVAGTPLQEPIAQYGPFVMNDEEQLQQAREDYRSGRLA
ncbi:pirin family protein [Acidithiobacillus sp. CV18-2]|nr:pirin family protein [Acidithiobacillus sp. CV18-3]MBU2758185.1 pirin family protein [Acidithiobacillus sp. BN09-2]MBU2778305.1 pirin family protein [Acidithiobacillus sp. CV18-2]MBU2798965.1 pirin family protein [Acidithiobacillus sp. VAN18-4]